MDIEYRWSDELCYQNGVICHGYYDIEGNIMTFKDGKLHSNGDEPAIIWANGDKEWFQNGSYYRDNMKPHLEYADGTCNWVYNDMFYSDYNEYLLAKVMK